MKEPKVCVIGGTGLLGTPVVRRCIAEGVPVRIVARSATHGMPRGEGVEFQAADVCDAGAIRSAIAGCTAIHISLQGGPRDEHYLAVEGYGVDNIVAAAVAEGVERITMLSGLIVGGINAPMLAEHNHLPASVFAKYYAENAIRSSGIPYAVFRPSNFIEGLARSTNGRRAAVPGGMRALYHWVCAEEFAGLVVRTIVQRVNWNATLAVLGPEAYTIADAMEIFVEGRYPNARIVTIPRFLLTPLSLFSPPLRMGLRMLKFLNGREEASLCTAAETIRLTRSIESCCEEGRNAEAVLQELDGEEGKGPTST